MLSSIKPCISARWRRNQGCDFISENIDEDIARKRIQDPELEPLINNATRLVTMAVSAKYYATATIPKSALNNFMIKIA